jgi:hypothetical protein
LATTFLAALRLGATFFFALVFFLTAIVFRFPAVVYNNKTPKGLVL